MLLSISRLKIDTVQDLVDHLWKYIFQKKFLHLFLRHLWIISVILHNFFFTFSGF